MIHERKHLVECEHVIAQSCSITETATGTPVPRLIVQQLLYLSCRLTWHQQEGEYRQRTSRGKVPGFSSRLRADRADGQIKPGSFRGVPGWGEALGHL